MFYIILYCLIFREMELFSYNSEQFLIFCQKSCFSYISGSGNPEKTLFILGNGTFFTFQEIAFWAWKMKKPTLKVFLIFREMGLSSPKSGKPLIFQEVICKAWKSKISYTVPYQEAKFSKSKFFLIIIIKCFFSFYDPFLYTQPVYFFIFWEVFVTFTTMLLLF